MPEAPAVVLSVNALGKPSFAFSDSRLGFGYVDEKAIPTLTSLDLGDRSTSGYAWQSSRVVSASRGSLSISTSVGYHGGRFGFAWTSEREGGRSGVRFSTFAEADATVSEVELASPDSGRYARSTDPVYAYAPVVSAAPKGFFVAWTDTRTAEPVRQGTNIAGWTGIYGQTFDSSGSPVGDDVQVEQSFIPHTYAGVTAGERFTFLFTDSSRSESIDLFTRQGEPSTFAPTTTPALFHLERRSPADRGGAAMATGPDGRVLVVAGASGDKGAYAGSLLLGTSGKVDAPYAEWADEDFVPAAVAAGPNGYVVASNELVAPDKVEVKAIKLLFLDLNGAKTGQARVELPSSDRSASGLALLPTARGTFVAVLSSPAQLEDRANGYEVVLAKVCPSK